MAKKERRKKNNTLAIQCSKKKRSGAVPHYTAPGNTSTVFSHIFLEVGSCSENPRHTCTPTHTRKKKNNSNNNHATDNEEFAAKIFWFSRLNIASHVSCSLHTLQSDAPGTLKRILNKPSVLLAGNCLTSCLSGGVFLCHFKMSSKLCSSKLCCGQRFQNSV